MRIVPALIVLVLLLFSACAQALPRDGAHPMARLLENASDERYLPQGMTDAASVLRAYNEGVLREPVLTALDISGDQAFIFFGRFAKSRMGPTFNTLTVCHEPSGFRLLASVDATACDRSPDAGLRFVRQEDGDLHCEICAALELPLVWERHDTQSR
ncbi:hypothetical protein E5C33_20590 [Stenotrophomonas maltophilia]|uniref:hypothetical protein n=1 Tax=Stenotrophomonas maltophilia TaxID=40324 RepID=UPI001075E444|nr:hypothetical protein [Stenotrophomonas maltophilia]TFZ42144.1 hypothetical protein E5C33_20590 [Stenotrophomonas maltophilia]